jgi:hypothetical protein
VILPYEQYVALMTIIEDLVIAERVAARGTGDDGRRYTLEDVADEAGIDLDTL